MRIAEPAAGLPGWGVAPRLGVMTLVPPFLRPSFRPMMRLAACLLLFWLSVLPMQTWAQTGEQAGALADAVEEIDADVLFLRHALAPGFGDPASFRIDDCRTQRNLSQAGRDQSRRIGDYLRGEGLTMLETLGMKILLPEARRIFREGGARCDEASEMVWIGREMVEAALNSAPRSILCRAARRDRDVLLEPGTLVFQPGAGAPHATDLERGRRPGTATDFRELVQLTQHFEAFHHLRRA